MNKGCRIAGGSHGEFFIFFLSRTIPWYPPTCIYYCVHIWHYCMQIYYFYIIIIVCIIFYLICHYIINVVIFIILCKYIIVLFIIIIVCKYIIVIIITIFIWKHLIIILSANTLSWFIYQWWTILTRAMQPLKRRLTGWNYLSNQSRALPRKVHQIFQIYLYQAPRCSDCLLCTNFSKSKYFILYVVKTCKKKHDYC